MFLEKPSFEVVKINAEDIIVTSTKVEGGSTCVGTEADCDGSYAFG